MFVVICRDKPGALQVRLDNRAAHLAFLNANLARLVEAGPIQTEDRTGMTGSVLIFNIAERAELDALLAQDPYAQAGLFESVTILPWKKVLP